MSLKVGPGVPPILLQAVMENETETVVLQRRAVRAARPIKAGTTISAGDLVLLRPCPADALPPARVSEVENRTAARDILAGDCVRLADLA